jgi:hypothetical protein
MLFTTPTICVGISTAISGAIVWKYARSSDPLILKLGVALVALIPFLGPVLALWIINMPAPQPPQLQDRSRYTTDVEQLWRSVIKERNPVARFRRWHRIMHPEKSDEREP